MLHHLRAADLEDAAFQKCLLQTVQCEAIEPLNPLGALTDTTTSKQCADASAASSISLQLFLCKTVRIAKIKMVLHARSMGAKPARTQAEHCLDSH
jgi:hypothetical protein